MIGVPFHGTLSAISREDHKGKISRLRRATAPRLACPHAPQLNSKGDLDEKQKRELLAALAIMLVSEAAESDTVVETKGPKQLLETTPQYYQATQLVQSSLKDVLHGQLNGAERKEQLAAFRSMAARWVNNYKKLVNPARKSFSVTYGLINAVTGHITLYGPEIPLPEAQKARLAKRLQQAEAAVAREQHHDAEREALQL
jgi:hypothetical protein